MTDNDAALAAQLQAELDRQDVGFAVEPITTCPHVPSPIPTHVFLNQTCGACQEQHENWQCLTCNTVLCSRYRNGHMVEHFEETKDHAVCLSYSDLSVWCFKCESYIANEVSINFFLLLNERLTRASFNRHCKRSKKWLILQSLEKHLLINRLSR